jgi:hypothetical protein
MAGGMVPWLAQSRGDAILSLAVFEIYIRPVRPDEKLQISSSPSPILLKSLIS